MQYYFCAILFIIALFVSPALSTDCGDIRDGCKKCKGNTCVGCRGGQLMDCVPCPSGQICVLRADGCTSDCKPGTISQQESGSNTGGSHPQSQSGQCTTGNRGETVPNGCSYCMSDSDIMTCSNSQWLPPKRCGSGKCEGGRSQNLKVACDGRCALSGPPKSQSAGGRPCTTGNKGDTVPDGCTYCMSSELSISCHNGQWANPKTCQGGQKCKGGLSHNLKVECDGRCE